MMSSIHSSHYRSIDSDNSNSSTAACVILVRCVTWIQQQALHPTVHLRSINRQLLAVPRYHLNTYGRRAFSVASPKVWTLELSPRFHPRPDRQCRLFADVCLKRTCSLDTSAFSALEVLDDNRAL